MRNANAKSADPKRFYDNSLIQQVNRDHAAKLFPGKFARRRKGEG